MAHLWVVNRNGEWVVQALEEDVVVLPTHMRDRSWHVGEPDPNAGLVTLMRVKGANTEVWLLMAGVGADVRINGASVAGGIRVLCDRDEIYVKGRRSYFSTETLARVVRFAGMEAPARCPRCQQTIEAGTDAVKCPRCGVWHHQSASLPCWTYTDTCAICPHSTDLEAGYRWTPEGLEP